MYDVKIEKDVPCPFVGKGTRNGVKYPEARIMEVGDSVYYPGSLFDSKDDLKRLVTAFARYANYAKKHFRQQYDEDGGVRIWRVR
jgi:hypothetical protein